MGTYKLKTSSTQVNEGDTLTTTLSTIDVITGKTLYYRVVGKGINAKDFSKGALTGTLKVGADGKATLTHALKNDSTTEGSESLTIQVFSDKKMKNLVGQSDAVTIADTSKKAVKGNNAQKDPITGEVIFGMPYGYDLVPTNGKGSYARYFCKANPTKIGFDIYGDTDKNMVLSSNDKYLGFANAISINSSVQGESGTFWVDSSKNTLEVFIGGQSVGLLSSSNVGF